MTTDGLDVVVIGGGPAGYVAALRASQLGGKVALVERENVGGTCLNRGCIPTKALISSVEVLSTVRSAARFGVKVEGVSLDFAEMQARKGRIVSQLVKGVEYLLNRAKVDVVRGSGSMLEPGAVRVVSESGSTQVLRSRSVIIATGSQPSGLPSCRCDGVHTITSEQALELTSVPTSLLVVGAGPIGMEFATIFAELGSAVTVVEMLPQVLPGVDTEIATIAERELKKRRVKVLTGAGVQGTALRDGKVATTLTNGQDITTDVVLVSVGRTCDCASLGVEELRIALERGMIKANEKMETTARGIYAAGDIVGGPLLAHKAFAEGLVAAENAMGGASVMDYRVIPRCIYTLPEIASVGHSEQSARDAGLEMKTGSFPFRASGRAQAAGQFEGLVKLIGDARSDELLGAHIIGAHATELIGELALALKLGARIEDLAQTVHAHPTMSEAVMEAAHVLRGRAIHV